MARTRRTNAPDTTPDIIIAADDTMQAAHDALAEAEQDAHDAHDQLAHDVLCSREHTDDAPAPTITARVIGPVNTDARITAKKLTATIAPVELRLPIGTSGETLGLTVYAVLQAPGMTPYVKRDGADVFVSLDDCIRSANLPTSGIVWPQHTQAEADAAIRTAMLNWPGLADATESAYRRMLRGVPTEATRADKPTAIRF
jgi:hypothetical protein